MKEIKAKDVFNKLKGYCVYYGKSVQYLLYRDWGCTNTDDICSMKKCPLLKELFSKYKQKK